MNPRAPTWWPQGAHCTWLCPGETQAWSLEHWGGAARRRDGLSTPFLSGFP